MAKRDVKRVDVKRVDEEVLEREIAQYQVLLANSLNREALLEQRGAPDWMLERYIEERYEMVQTISRLKNKLNRVRPERSEAYE